MIRKTFLGFGIMAIALGGMTAAALAGEKNKSEIPAAGTAQVNEAWDKTPPEVNIQTWGGEELRIRVIPHKKMSEEKRLAIQAVKMTSETGEFLGLKTYAPAETNRDAEFMVNPVLLKLDKVKVTVTSSADGDWEKVVPLIVPEIPKPEVVPEGLQEASVSKTAAVEAPAAANAVKAEEPKAEVKKTQKKKWNW